MSSISTRILHPTIVDTSHTDPLTLPIYETTTFVFDSAAQVRVPGRAERQVPLHALRQSDRAQRRADAVDRRHAGGAPLLLGHGGDDHHAAGADAGRRRSGLQRGDLRRHAARAPTCCRFGVTTRFLGLDDLRTPETAISNRTRLVWFESPINRRCAAWTSRPSHAPAGRAACCQSSTTPLQARSTSSRSLPASIW